MSVRRYTRYKDSGVDWLGAAPAHWQVLRNKVLFREIDERSATDEGELLTVSHLTGVTPRSEKNVNMTMAETLEGYKTCSAGDLVINTMWAWMGALGISPCDGLVSPSYNVYRARDITKLDPSYYDYLFRTTELVAMIKAHSTGVWESRLRLYPDTFLALRSPFPPMEEQRAIASFLSHETEKIDALISEQQRLIELLAEKRRAVTSNAVLPQPGEKTTALGHLIDLKPGFAFPSELFSSDEQGIRLLRGINVGVGECRWDETVYWTGALTDSIREFSLLEGDIVLGMDRPWIKSGTRVAQVRREDLPCLLVQRVARIRARAGQNQSFIRLVLESQEFKSYLEADLTGISVPHISPQQISSFPTRLLPESQQSRIATEAELDFRRIDGLVSEAERAILLLQERRSAIIWAAVVGRIDVRGFVTAQPEREAAA